MQYIKKVIDRGTTLEPTGTMIQNKKNNAYPSKYQFYYKKTWGVGDVRLHGLVNMMSVQDTCTIGCCCLCDFVTFCNFIYQIKFLN